MFIACRLLKGCQAFAEWAKKHEDAAQRRLRFWSVKQPIVIAQK
jgi:hypothetical protein